MIDKVYFEISQNNVISSADFGLILKSFDAPEPEPQTHRVTVQGADGTLDMTEWAGVVRYNDRTVTMVFRDMRGGGHERLVNTLHGRKCRFYLSSDPDWYFIGRCEKSGSQTRWRVTDTPLVFTCQPYKEGRFQTMIKQAVTSGTSIQLKAARRPAAPTVKLTAACSLTWNGTTTSLAAGTHTVPGLIITDTPGTLTVSGSGKITISWTEGVL